MTRFHIFPLAFLLAAALLAGVGCGSGEDPPGPSTSHITVWKYTPAPGQFVNQSGATTAEEARAWAEERLNAGLYVSLGGWGGYIVVGLGESVTEFTVTGNQFETSSEPGIVWVMTDTNGNGRPDDTWLELPGSETGAEGTVQDHEKTWRRDELSDPAHYPAWVAEDSYILRGTRLASNVVPGGIWEMTPYEWGYADNWGTDRIGNGRKNLFTVESPIDFIKIQTAIDATAGPLGEVSTEVCGLEAWSE